MLVMQNREKFCRAVALVEMKSREHYLLYEYLLHIQSRIKIWLTFFEIAQKIGIHLDWKYDTIQLLVSYQLMHNILVSEKLRHIFLT